jgi:hypothetical protein
VEEIGEDGAESSLQSDVVSDVWRSRRGRSYSLS